MSSLISGWFLLRVVVSKQALLMRNLYQLCNVCDLFDGMSERDWNLFFVSVSIVIVISLLVCYTPK